MKDTNDLGAVEHTERGFEVIYFEDHYEHMCSLQQSSLADGERPGASAVWLGVVDAEPKIMAKHAKQWGIKTEQTTGWVDIPLPDEVQLHTRAHLSREQVIALIASLQRWVNTGSFERTEIDEIISENLN